MKNNQDYGENNANKDVNSFSRLDSSPHPEQLQCQPDIDTEREIRRELLRRSQYSYNIHSFAVVTSIAIALVGCWFVFSGMTKEGTFTAVAGLGASAYLTQTGKESQESLEALIQRLDRSHPD
ncbi:TRADD-N-associated membrane domain-containing protein [Nostoc sp.]|uniref:TRADD-N-associated membrane domain-containing protein n=1 Tax=Nostoc sp. TaxID=1180 RepID=UPI002FF79DCC